MPKKTYSSETKALYSKLRNVSIKKHKPFFDDEEIKALINITRSDLEIDMKSAIFDAPKSFYDCKIEDIRESLKEGEDVRDMLDELRIYPDAQMYLSSLTSIHRHRTRYSAILKLQPLPQPIQVFPRAIIEFNNGDDNASFLANWLVWRKWIYDIDNRSAQETGNLFEPILTSALGGKRYSAKGSVIRRKDNPSKGRQVDCIVDDKAYEFKMRVTIAASGQGRFKEELSFAEDAEFSRNGDEPFKPILIVLDPTESDKLTELSAKYEKHGGEVYTGDAAWHHLEESAGKVMGLFLEKYIREPISRLGSIHSGKLEDLSINIRGDKIIIGVGSNNIEIDRIKSDDPEDLIEDILDDND